jgi:holliday junction DNA helicase RuvA
VTPTNLEIARKLRKHATELARGGDNLYRVRAFRQAAMAVLALPEEVSALVAADGRRALERLPGIGKSLAGTIAKYLEVGV